MKEFKLYNTLKAESFRDSGVWSESSEAFEDELNEALRNNNTDLAEYADETVFADRIKSIRIETEKYKDKLYGVAVCTATDDWNEADTEALKEYLIGQYADGWGEGFEQRPIIEFKDNEEMELFDEESGEEYYGKVEVDVEICISFWQSDDNYRIMTEEELKG